MDASEGTPGCNWYYRKPQVFFALLEKTRLGNEKPDYHTLVVALMQILHGLLLNTWCRVCGFPILAAFAESQPSPERLLEIAVQILEKYATPMEEHDISQKWPATGGTDYNAESVTSNESDNSSESGSTESVSSHDPQDDQAHWNILLLTRDLLYVAELLCAVSDSNYGHIEDILGNLAMMFWGGGLNNYCMELLHFIFNLKMVWGDDFA